MKNNSNTAVSQVVVPLQESPRHLLNTIKSSIGEFCSLPNSATVGAVLWCGLSHAYDRPEIEHAPRLTAMSPTPECGKTVLFGVLSQLVPNPYPTSNATPAVMFRLLNQRPRPTLLCDEFDSLGREQREALRNILNAGHARDTAFVDRNGPGKDGGWVPERFSTWGGVAIGMIGKPASTIRSRSVVLPLQRKERGDVRRRLTPEARKELRVLGAKLGTLVGKLKLNPEPSLPAELGNRDADNWRGMVSIADAVGGDWPSWARAAAVTLTTGVNAVAPHENIQLLEDIRAVFGDSDKLHTETLLDGLRDIETSAWGWLSPSALAERLGYFRMRDGTPIKPKQVKIGSRNRNGYHREWLEEAWRVYLGGR